VDNTAASIGIAFTTGSYGKTVVKTLITAG
jgi:hypothetical protein